MVESATAFKGFACSPIAISAARASVDPSAPNVADVGDAVAVA